MNINNPITLTLKAKLYSTPEQSHEFDQLTTNYARACSYVSGINFRNGCHLSAYQMHKWPNKKYGSAYYAIKALFDLKAQEANSVFNTVQARYSSVDTQRRHRRHSVMDTNAYKMVKKWNKYTKSYDEKLEHPWYYYYEDAGWLWHPIHFHSPQADLTYYNDWRIYPKKHEVAITVLSERTQLRYYLPKCYRKYLALPHQLGGAKLIHKDNYWYLYISCTLLRMHRQIPNTSVQNVNGSDRGQRFLHFSYNSHGKSVSYKGLKLRKKRSHFLKQRMILQHKNTRSAKRKLKSISGRENCWMTHVNHAASKALVQSQPKHTAFGLEGLRGVKFAANDSPKKEKYGRVSWAFYQFGSMLEYKAPLLNGGEVKHVNKNYTSQRDPRHGDVNGKNRNHHLHTYFYKDEYRSNDDRIAAINIAFLTKLQILGYDRPFISKTGQIGYHKDVHKRDKQGRKLKKIINKIFYLDRKQALNVTSRN